MTLREKRHGKYYLYIPHDSKRKIHGKYYLYIHHSSKRKKRQGNYYPYIPHVSKRKEAVNICSHKEFQYYNVKNMSDNDMSEFNNICKYKGGNYNIC